MALNSQFIDIIDPSINEVLPSAPLDLTKDPLIGVDRSPTNDPFVTNRVVTSPEGSPGVGSPRVGINTPTDTRRLTFGAPIPEPAGKTFSEKFKEFGDKNDLPTLLGTLAHAVAPDTIGGRVGKGIVGIQASEAKARGEEADREIRRGALETSKRSSGALTGFRADAARIAKAKFEAAKEELKRTKEFGELVNTIYTTDPSSPEHKLALGRAMTIGTMADLTALGIIQKAPTPSFGIGEVPGQPGTFGTFERSTGEFVVDNQGNLIQATPGQVGIDQPRFQLVTTTDAQGNPVLSFAQTSGPGAGPGTITSTGVGVPANGKQRFFSPAAINARRAAAAKESKPVSGIKTDKAGIVEMTEIVRPDGKTRLRVPTKNLQKFIDTGYTQGVQ